MSTAVMNRPAETAAESPRLQLQVAAQPHASFEDANTGAQKDPDSIGMYYIHGAALMNRPADEEGRCTYLLEAYRIPDDKMPGQVRDMRFHPREAEYIVYLGNMKEDGPFSQRAKFDPREYQGLVVGYMEHCFVDRKMQVLGTDTPVVNRMRSVMYPRPRIEIDWDHPRFGNYAGLVATPEQHRCIMEAREEMWLDRHPYQRKTQKTGLKCLGGK